MHQRKIGSLNVSAIGLGCMNISGGYGPGDDEVSVELLNRALDAGYTFMDTALVYGEGHSETLIQTALHSRRNDYVLATKCGLSRAGGIDGRPETLQAQCEGSLERLGTDVIDLYYLHRMDPKVPIEESVGALGRLVEQGKVREIGLSEVSTATLLRAQGEHPIAALQSEYSLWSRTPERGILDACRQHGITFVPFSPLARAFLTGKSTDVTNLPENDLRCTIARPRFESAAFASNSKLLGPYAAIAERAGCSMAQLALAWLLARHDRTMVPIPGTKHIDFMLENGEASEIQLDAATVSELDELINEKTITGTRYSEERMQEADAEQD